MKKIELFIPDRRLDDVIEVLKDANIGGMSQYRIEGMGKIKPEDVYVGRGTMTYKPKFIPRTKVEVVVSDEKVERLISAFSLLLLLLLSMVRCCFTLMSMKRHIGIQILGIAFRILAIQVYQYASHS